MALDLAVRAEHSRVSALRDLEAREKQNHEDREHQEYERLRAKFEGIKRKDNLDGPQHECFEDTLP